MPTTNQENKIFIKYLGTKKGQKRRRTDKKNHLLLLLDGAEAGAVTPVAAAIAVTITILSFTIAVGVVVAIFVVVAAIVVVFVDVGAAAGVVVVAATAPAVFFLSAVVAQNRQIGNVSRILQVSEQRTVLGASETPNRCIYDVFCL